MLTRACTLCGRIHKQGERCPKERDAAKDAAKDYNLHKRDPVTNGFYHSKSWSALRSMIVMSANGFDEYELAFNSRLVIGTIVHHIIPVDECPALRLNRNNLILLSDKTHKLVHRAYDHGGDAKLEMQNKLRLARGTGGGAKKFSAGHKRAGAL